ncbi:hypothetical protein COHCIP112018_02847 [Cohnella sp. JJ-181]|nr:hypothetical protein COHCIP112018_02847 [Cohnella sp. JJ-181]
MALPLEADMTILAINRIKVNAGSTPVQVTAIGRGEFQFISPLNLPNKPHLWLDFKSRIPRYPLWLQGKIIWHAKIGENCYEYGVQV